MTQHPGPESLLPVEMALPPLIWVGGGVSHGPRPRAFVLSIPKKIAQLALKSALSLKAKEGRVKLLMQFTFKEPKTSKAASLLKKLKVGGRVLIVISKRDLDLYRSFRNKVTYKRWDI